MDDIEQFRKKLERSLEGAVERPEVRAAHGDFSKIVGVIVSPSFEGMDEAQRQEIVWGRVLDHFDEAEQRRIEFLYTDAPSEVGSTSQ